MKKWELSARHKSAAPGKRKFLTALEDVDPDFPNDNVSVSADLQKVAHSVVKSRFSHILLQRCLQRVKS